MSYSLETVDSNRKLNGLICYALIGFNCVGIAVAITVYLNLSGMLNARTGSGLLEGVRSDYDQYLVIEKAAREQMGITREIESSLVLDETAADIDILAAALIDNEKSYQIFYRLLKVNIYHLAGQIPGTYSWYEIWSPEIDAAIERSQSRQLQLLNVRQRYQP